MLALCAQQQQENLLSEEEEGTHKERRFCGRVRVEGHLRHRLLLRFTGPLWYKMLRLQAVSDR